MRPTAFRPLAIALVIAACAPAASGAGAAAPAADTTPPDAADRAQIERVVRASIGWALTKDKDLLFECMAQDSGFFIFHPDSKGTIVGFEAFRALADEVFMDPRFQAKGFEIRDLRIHLSRGGDVAWFSALLDDRGEWDGRDVSWKDARWTGVLERRAGKWVIAQMHFSLASDVVAAQAARRDST